MKKLFRKKGPLGVLFYLLTLVTFHSSISRAESRFFTDLYRDQARPIMNRAFDIPSVRILITGTAGTFLARANDDSMRSQWRDHQKMSIASAEVGDFLGTGIPGGLIALTQYYGWDDEGGAHHLRALISTGLVTQTMKFGFGRGRPGDNKNHESFPSGHTSTTFASATVLSYTYGWKVGLIAYPLATFTAFSRMADDVHWFSDVVAGAALGIWLGRASYLNKDTEPDPLAWAPIVTSKYVGAQFEWVF